jgi:hypothetical protein
MKMAGVQRSKILPGKGIGMGIDVRQSKLRRKL